MRSSRIETLFKMLGASCSGLSLGSVSKKSLSSTSSVSSSWIASPGSSALCGVMTSAPELISAEGYQDARWVLMDYGAIIVHVFQTESREYYNLEDLWADAERREVQDSAEAA